MKSKKIKYLLLILVISIFIALSTSVYAQDDVVVILDPGHGGWESGAVGGNLVEKNLTWKIATKVKQILDNTPGITGILTRGENDNPTLRDRGLLAKNTGADLLVSFHINSSTSSRASGAETYITGNTNNPRFYEASKTLGESVLANLRGVGVPTRVYKPILRFSTDGELYADGFLSDYYGIIRNPMYYGIPGVLIEHAYISNPNDRNNYLNDWKLNEMAEADARAIISNKELFRIDRTKNSMNSQLLSLNVDKSIELLSGEMVVVDWINGMPTVPNNVPNITLKSTDGESVIPCYVEHKNGNTYYFATWNVGLDRSKEYRIEVSAQDKVNIPIYNTMNTNLNENRWIGEDTIYDYYVENNIIKSETKIYVGDLTSGITRLNTVKVANNQYCIEGEIVAVEWIDGKGCVPRKMPTITLRSSKGETIGKCYVKQLIGNNYYFGININGIDMAEQYYFEIESENKNNLSQHKKHVVYLANLPENVGRCQNDKMITIKDNQLEFENYIYIGNLNSELKKIDVEKCNGATFISGEIVIIEWIDGVGVEPEKLPKMRFKDDGGNELDTFVTKTGNYTYYFGRYIEGIDTNKEYCLEIESGDSKNVSQYRKINVYFTNTKYNNKIIGKYNDKNIKLVNQNIKFVDDTYIGNLNSELKKFNVEKCDGATFVSGEIIIIEWIDGVGTEAEILPKMRFKDKDGNELEAFVTKTGPYTYYFGRYIEGIDTNKEYYLEIESGNSKNVSQYRKIDVYFINTIYNNQVVGRYNEYNIKLLDRSIIFEKLTKESNKTIDKVVDDEIYEKIDNSEEDEQIEKIENIEQDEEKTE